MEPTLKDLKRVYDLASVKAADLRWRLETTKSEPACSEQAAKAQLLASELRAWQGRIEQVLALLARIVRRERNASRDAEAFLSETAGQGTPTLGPIEQEPTEQDAITPSSLAVSFPDLPLFVWPALDALHGTETAGTSVFAADAIIGTDDRPPTRQTGRKRKQKVLRQGGQATRSSSDRRGYE